MSLHRTVAVGSLEYDFAPGDPGFLARRLWALATARVIDEITGDPIALPLRVRVVVPGEGIETTQDGQRLRIGKYGVFVKTGADGTFCLVARPWDRFPPLFGAAPQIDVIIEANGYLPLAPQFTLAYNQRMIALPAPAAGAQTLTLNSTNGLVAGQALLIGPVNAHEYARIGNLGPGENQVTLTSGVRNAHNVGDPVFPDTFDPGPTKQLSLHRQPIVVAGRVVRRNTAANVSNPISGAKVTVTDLWRTRNAVRTHQPGTMTNPNPALRSFALSIASGALAARAAGARAGTLALPTVAGDDKLLRRDVAAGVDTIELSDRRNLAPGRMLRIDADDAAIAEYHTINAVAGVGGIDEPAQITFDLELARPHRRAARVERVNLPGALPPTPLTLRDATLPGDTCVFVDTVVGLPPQGPLRLTSGGAADEYQTFAQLAVTTDAGGYFRLPAIHRVAQLQIVIDDGANPQTIDFQPDYTQREQWLDVAFPA